MLIFNCDCGQTVCVGSCLGRPTFKSDSFLTRAVCTALFIFKFNTIYKFCIRAIFFFSHSLF